MSKAIVQAAVLPNQNQDRLIKETFDLQGQKLLQFIRNKVNDDEVAKDIFQDVFYELTSNFRLAKNIDKVSSWIFSVARNKIIDLFRKKKTKSLDALMEARNEENEIYFTDFIKDDALQPFEFFDNKVLMEAITEALDELPGEQKEVFILHEIEGLSFKEISGQTGVSVNTLLSRKRYAVLHLRNKLADLYAEYTN